VIHETLQKALSIFMIVQYALTNLGQAAMAAWQDNENNKTQIIETHKHIRRINIHLDPFLLLDSAE